MRSYLKNSPIFIFTFLSGILFISCSEDSVEVEKATAATTPPVTAEYEIENFIYRGMSDVYLYKKDVAVLKENYFASQAKKNNFFATYSLSNGYLKALASYGTAYITPSLYQLYDAVYGNPNLEPESSSTIEAGMELDWKNFRISGVYFERKTQNFVDFVTIDPENFLFQYRNIDENFKARGVEIELKAGILPSLDLTGNYTYTKADERFALRIPTHKVNAALGYKINEDIYTSLTYQFNDVRSDSFFNSESFENEVVLLNKYGILNYFISYHVNENVRIFAGVDNITNESYEEIYRFTTRGRNGRIGLALNF